MKHRRKVKSEQVIILQMDQELKNKNISDASWQLFCCRRKDKLLLETKCIDDQYKFQSVKDTDNEFTECQTARKKAQSIGISPVSLHAFMKTLQSNFSEA